MRCFYSVKDDGFRNVTPLNFVGRYNGFGEIPSPTSGPKMHKRKLATKLHGIKLLKPVNFIYTVVETSDMTSVTIKFTQ